MQRSRFRTPVSVVSVLATVVAGVALLAAGPAALAAQPTDVVAVPALAETAPVAHGGDSADDPAIWVDPSDPARSLVIGNDKGGALETYDLSGALVQRITTPAGKWGNVDVRQDVGIPGVASDVVAAVNGGIRFYGVDPSTRTLSAITDGSGVVATSGEGLCLYHSRSTGGLYAFIVLPSGTVRQYAVTDDDHDGLLSGALVRTFSAGGEAEGCVADDATGALYLAEEDVALWRYGAEPTDGTARTAIDTVVSAGGRLAPDIEGVTAARRTDGSGVLIASAQNVADRAGSYFAVYDLDGTNAYRSSFRVVDGTAADDCDGTDGVAAHAGPLGTAFPDGLFVCQDNSNSAPGTAGNQDFKLASMAQVLAPPGQLPPKAAVAASCDGLACTFDGSGSTDTDGQVTGWSWELGDGSADVGPSVTHTYPASGSYTVRLTVTDDAGLTGVTTRAVTVPDPGGVDPPADPPAGPVSFVAAASSNGNSATGRVTVPAGVAAGDTLVLFASTGSASIATPTGWSSAGTRSSSPLLTTLFTRTATTADAGSAVNVAFAGQGKYGLALAAYRGVDPSAPVAGLASVAAGSGSSRVTPALSITAPAWVVSYWNDRSSSVTSWSGPSSGVRRVDVLGTGGGRITGLLADSGAPLPAGSVGGVTASSNTTAGRATMWTVALRAAAPGPVPQPPTAVATVGCQDLQCQVDASGSSDPDGQVVSYSWSFGDGTASSSEAASHTYATGGTYLISLTVTDDTGLTGTTSRSVTVAPAGQGPAQGTPYTWGGNDFGQLGDGSTLAHLTAAAVSDLSGVVDLDGGREHVIALRDDHTVATWGSDEMGQLGLGGGGDRTTPTTVAGLSGIVAVAAGHYHCLALDGSGRVWAWGLNNDGQLGDGTTTQRSSPVEVSGLTDVVSVAAGRDMSYAVRSDGTVWAWGLNSAGQLGDGTTTSHSTPVRVGSLSGVVQVAGGRDHGLALDSSGRVWAWGTNADGELGDGTTTDRTLPVQVATGMSAVDAGADHSYALRTSDGQVMAWGRNYRDELGDGTSTDRSTPVEVTGVDGAVALGSGRDHGLAVLADGSVMAWGYNAGGQLGDGTTTSRSTAVMVQGVSGAMRVAGGALYSVALVGGTPPPGNKAPTANATVTCDGLSCSASAAGSFDPDGQIVSYSWDFGDGALGTGQQATHDYAAAGDYLVGLTVTDDDGATGTTSRSVTVGSPPAGNAIAFVARSGSDANSSNPAVTVPTTVGAGDALVLVASLASSEVAATTPAGWTLVDEAVAGRLATTVYRRTATAADAGSTVTLALSGLSKTSMQLVAYSGVAAGDFVDVDFTVAASSGTVRTAPAMPVTVAGSWALSYWADRSSSDRTWTAPGGVTVRGTTYGTGGGRVSSLLADSGGPLATGTYPARTASTSASGAQAIGATLVLLPAG